MFWKKRNTGIKVGIPVLTVILFYTGLNGMRMCDTVGRLVEFVMVYQGAAATCGLPQGKA